MGSWHSTCFFSNTSIHCGERVIALILERTFHSDDSRIVSYHNEFNQMIGFALEGDYDDYGRIMNIVPNPHMEAYLQDQDLYVKETKGYDSSFHKYEWVSLEDFVKKIERGKMYKKTFKSFHIIEMVMIHYELYQQLMNEMRNRIPYKAKDTFAELQAQMLELEQQFGEKREFLAADTINAVLNDDAKPSFEVFIRSKVSLCLDVLLMENYIFNKKVAELDADKSLDEDSNWRQWLRLSIQRSEFTKLYGSDKMRDLNFMADRYVDNPDETIIDGIVETIIWDKVMTYSRVGYFCVPGAGSDDCEMVIPLIVANFVKKLYQNRCKSKNSGRETMFCYGIDDHYLPLLRKEDNPFAEDNE